MTKCDKCGVELPFKGVVSVTVSINDGPHDWAGEVSVLADDGDDLVPVDDRDLCEPCTAKWIIKLLGPVANPNMDAAENKD